MIATETVDVLVEILRRYQNYPTAAERAAMITNLLISDCQLTRDLRELLNAATAEYERETEENRCGFPGGTFVSL